MPPRITQKTRVSDFYQLGLTQPSLEFLDVRLQQDSKLFVDPRAFLALQTDWGDECVDLIRTFFDDVLQAIREDDHQTARRLLSGLHEPKESRLGFSQDSIDGHGVGDGLADSIYRSLAESEAVEHGLIENLEDTALMVEGIGVDRVSDITTNIVRAKLIEFTVEIAEKYGMDLIEANSGPIWSQKEKRWINEQVPMLVPGNKPLILIPRTVARWKMDYDPGEYYRAYVLPFLQDVELGKAHSPLVQVVQTGRNRGERYVTKKSVDKHYRKRLDGGQKKISVDVTKDFPHVFKQFKQNRRRMVRAPISFMELHERIGTPAPDWDDLLNAVLVVPPGRKHADDYHRAIEALVTPLFAGNLTDPKREKITGGNTQRIDVRYRNMARAGFFRWFTDQFSKAPFVPFECKNLSGDPANDEIGQIASRLNKNRGMLGFIVCRKIDKREKFLTRCRQELVGDKYIIGLTDKELQALVKTRKESDGEGFTKILADLLEELVD